MQMPEMRIGRFRLPDNAMAAEMDKLCFNLIGGGQSRKKILITSCRRREGTEFIAMNLLRAFAEMGIRVVLLEADLRRPKLQSEFDIHVRDCKAEQYPGLCGYLRGNCNADDISGGTGLKNADLILAGAAMNHPFRLLGSERFGKLMNYLESKYDVVLVLAPAMEDSTDAIGLASFCDGTLFVVRSGGVSSSKLIQAINQMKKSGGSVMGTVLCRFEDEKRSGLNSMTEGRKLCL